MAKYVPISSTRNQIRLLRLQHNLSRDEIHGTTIAVDLKTDLYHQEVPCYSALSYEWGSPSQTCYTISINGWPTSIRKNLWDFLVHYRHAQGCHEPQSYLWIDAICIDQSSIQERNQQVKLMAEIYKRATKVIVWLGLHRDRSHLLMQAYLQTPTPSHAAGDMKPKDFTKFDMRSALKSWLSRTYWSRTWVIQEFLLGRRVELMCGEASVADTVVSKFIHRHSMLLKGNGHQHNIDLVVDNCAGLRLLSQCGHRHENKLPLLDLIIRNSPSKCSVPHDKVYSMLGLALSATSKRGMTVDYAMPLSYLIGEVLSVSEVPPKDTCRYVYTLKRILTGEQELVSDHTSSVASAETNIESEGFRPSKPYPRLSSISPGILKEGIAPKPNDFTVHGFVTGECVMNEPDSQLKPSASSIHLMKKNHEESQLDVGKIFRSMISKREFPGKLSSWSALAKQLSATTLDRLFRSWQELLNIKTWSFMSTDLANHIPINARTARAQSTTPPYFSYAVLFLSSRVSQPHVPALVCGDVMKGDSVVQFPGYDIGLILRKSSIGALRTVHMSGTFVCMKVDSAKNSREVASGSGSWDKFSDLPAEEFKFDFIRSPAETKAPNDRVSLYMASDVLVNFVQ